MNIIYLNCGKYELDRKKIIAVIDTTFAVVKRKPEKKKSGLYGIRTCDLCDTGAALSNQLSQQANWELVIWSKIIEDVASASQIENKANVTSPL